MAVLFNRKYLTHLIISNRTGDVVVESNLLPRGRVITRQRTGDAEVVGTAGNGH